MHVLFLTDFLYLQSVLYSLIIYKTTKHNLLSLDSQA